MPIPGPPRANIVASTPYEQRSGKLAVVNAEARSPFCCQIGSHSPLPETSCPSQDVDSLRIETRVSTQRGLRSRPKQQACSGVPPLPRAVPKKGAVKKTPAPQRLLP